MLRRLPAIAVSALLLAAVAACGSGDDASDNGGGSAGKATTEGRMGGAGPRAERGNLYLNIGSLSNQVGTYNGNFSLFKVECSPKKVTVSTGDGVSVEFTVGSQEAVFFHNGKEFARFTDEIEWGAGSSFQANLVQKSWGEGDAYRRATFTGSIMCP